MNEYDEVELREAHPEWALIAGARGTVIDVHGAERGFVTVEFYGPDEENEVHLVPIAALRVTDVYHAAATRTHHAAD